MKVILLPLTENISYNDGFKVLGNNAPINFENKRRLLMEFQSKR